MVAIAGSVAVVTGASSGIGEATARALGRSGAHVVLVARGRDKLESVAKDIRASGGKVTIQAVDASDADAVTKMAAEVRQTVGAPTFIINSAGTGSWRYLEETGLAEAKNMIGAPYAAAFNTSHAFMKDLLAAKQGVILHVGSPFSTIPWPGATAYGASRWALRGLHEALAQDLRGTGVHSCHVVFGKVKTAYFDSNPGSEEHIPTVAKIIPTLSAEACADVILDVLAKPRRDVQYPPMLKAFYLAERFMPDTVRWLVAKTGRSRSST